MTQAELGSELSQVTGESRGTIRHRGFQFVETPDPRPLVMDWDSLDELRVSYLPQRARRKHRMAA